MQLRGQEEKVGSRGFLAALEISIQKSHCVEVKNAVYFESLN